MMHKRIQSIGAYEIWLSPKGDYEVYSATALVAIKRTLQRAIDWANAHKESDNAY
jgi:hypothetical protein